MRYRTDFFLEIELDIIDSIFALLYQSFNFILTAHVQKPNEIFVKKIPIHSSNDIQLS